MQKVTAFLEQHVQWLAIGLGALFCLYMTYSYVITPPAEVTIGSDTFGPSEIDPHTADTVAQKLQAEMQKSSKIKMDVPQYVQAFQNVMTWKNAPPVTIVRLTDPAYTMDVVAPTAPQQPLPPGQQPLPDPNVVAQGDKIKALPVPPVPKYADVKYGRSVVVPQPAPGQAAAVPAPGVVPPGAVDKDWVTQMWTISMADLDAAFRNAGMQKAPPDLRKTMFLQVEMVREEMVDGQWVNPIVVPHNTPMRTGQPMMAYPGDEAKPELRQPQFQYAMWAATATPDIIQPIFHVTVPNKGDQWTKPGAQVGLQQIFNPALYKGDVNLLPKDQREAVMQWRRDQQRLINEQKKLNRPAPRAPSAPSGGRGGPDVGDGMNYAPGPRSSNSHNAPPVGALPHFALPPRVPQRGFNPNVPPDMMEMDGGEGAFGGYGGAPQAPGLPQPGTDYPTGEFDPSDSQPQPWKNKEVEIWAHDDQVAAGKTYRYKMRYKLKNPIFGTNAGDPATLGEQFALISEFSPWTTPITVPSLVNFFVAGGGLGGRNTVEFEIYRWDQGQQKVERFSVSPGDVVGWAKNGVDFSTDWTVVDFREDARANDRQILLVNNKDGKVVARSFQADAKDKLYEALKKQVKDAKAAENTAAAAGGATVGGTAAAR